jgi:tetratricopeptide (TPR) repeat protein
MLRLQYLMTLVMALSVGACHRHRIASPVASLPNFDLLYDEGLTAFHQGTPESYVRAAETFRRLSTLRPERCDYKLDLAQSLLFLASEQISNWEEFEPTQKEAAAVVDSAAEACTPAHEAFILRLRALIAGRGPTATGFINRALDLDAADPMNWVVLGYLDPANSRLVTPEGAGRWVAMTRAVALKPDSALIQYEFGRNYQSSRRDPDEPRKAFQRAIELSPRHFRAYLNLAYSADEDTDVQPLYDKVVEIAPNFLEGRVAAGSFYGAIDELDKAAEQYSAALAVNPKYDIAEFRLGLLMLEADRADEAEKHFKRVIELSPGSYEAWYRLGNISYNRKDYEVAKQQYEEAVRVRTNYAEAEYGLGWVYRQQNKNDFALMQFDKVIRIQPRFGDAYVSRGDIRTEQKQFPDALADYDKAIDNYQAQLQSLNATIANLAGRSSSRAAAAEKKRTERDRDRIQVLIERVRQYRSEVEDTLALKPRG